MGHLKDWSRGAVGRGGKREVSGRMGKWRGGVEWWEGEGWWGAGGRGRGWWWWEWGGGVGGGGEVSGWPERKWQGGVGKQRVGRVR